MEDLANKPKMRGKLYIDTGNGCFSSDLSEMQLKTVIAILDIHQHPDGSVTAHCDESLEISWRSDLNPLHCYGPVIDYTRQAPGVTPQNAEISCF
ncbi:MAG: hypothetical protein Q3982_07040 [Phoenicibacter congonensis]|uniref:Uncharacterized protein n=1 Tax=Phoenicibacter congonensis TaxID=1944646 RepID=A0AA43UBB2_9ACTN|nr:hypothetical protein [Phoenicibacter congonensis]